MGVTVQIEGAATVPLTHDGPRLRPLSDRPDTSEGTEALRAKLISATVEVVAEGASNPSLDESGVVRIPA